MSAEPSPPAPEPLRFRLFRNWLSLAGLLLMLGSIFAFLLLLIVDSLAHFSNPYVGVLTYLISPIFLFAGLLLVLLGGWVRHQRIRAQGGASALQIDLARPRDRKMLGAFLGMSVVFLLITSFETYNSYHFTESVAFCGKACHTVMQPELVSYEHGPHARVACTDCHIGPGATWYVRSKLSGTYQVYAVLRNKYPRPIPTTIENLRPAQETCEQCH